MKTGFILFAAAVLVVVCEARLAEKVSEDDDFVVYRIPVKALDLQSQATGLFEGYDISPHHGRSSSKSTSHSKSSSSSTGTGKGKGYGQGGSSTGHGQGYGGSSSGQGYGGSSSGHGHGHGGSGGGHGYGGSSGGQGYGGSSGGQGYGGSSGGQGYGGSSGGQGYGGSSGGQGYGGSSGGQGYGGSSGGHGYGSGGSGQGYGGSAGGHYRGGHGGYSPSYDSGSSQPYDEEEGDYPKVVTSTKTFTTNSAQDTGLGQHHQYKQPIDSIGDLRFKLGDYLKNAPGHEPSKFSQNLFEANPGFRSNPGFNVNEFTRTLNHGMTGAFNAPSYRNNRFAPQASIVIPRVYALRHSGFGFGGL